MKKFSIEFSERGHIGVGKPTWRLYVDGQFLGHHATLEDAATIAVRIQRNREESE